MTTTTTMTPTTTTSATGPASRRRSAIAAVMDWRFHIFFRTARTHLTVASAADHPDARAAHASIAAVERAQDARKSLSIGSRAH